MTEPAPRVLRMKLACKDHIQFLLEFAPKMKAKVFVPMEDPPPVGSRVTLHIRFSDGEVHVKGTAEVLKVVSSPRSGVHARYVSLDPDSVQFPLTKPSPPTAPAPHADDGQPTTGEAYVPPFSVSGEFRVHTPSSVAAPPSSAPSAPPPMPGARPSSPTAAAKPSAPPPAASPARPPPPARVASVLNPPPADTTAVTAAPAPPAQTKTAPAVDPFAADGTVPADAPPELLAMSATKTQPGAPAAAEPTRVERAPEPTRASPARRAAPVADDDEVGGPLPAARPKWPFAVGAVVLVAAIAGGAMLVLRGSSGTARPQGTDPALLTLLQKADASMSSKDYAGPGGSTALDHVRVAVKAAPDDAEVKKRQQALAAVFEEKAKAAEAAGDYAEAAVQLQALSLTEPGRAGVKERLARAEDIVVNQKSATP